MIESAILPPKALSHLVWREHPKFKYVDHIEGLPHRFVFKKVLYELKYLSGCFYPYLFMADSGLDKNLYYDFTTIKTKEEFNQRHWAKTKTT